MKAPPLTSRRVWVPAVLVLLALALLPSRWCIYGPPLRNAATTLLMPATRPLRTLSSTIHKRLNPPAPEEGNVEQLARELRRKDQLIIALQKRLRRLRRVNAELQGLRKRVGDSYVFRRAPVISRSSDPAARTLHLGAGSEDGIRVGMAAVDGANLVGRIVQVGRTSSTLKPITAEGVLLEAVLAPRRLPPGGLPADRRRTCLLEPAGPRLLVATGVDRGMTVEEGDYARLYDATGPESWPRSVQGMILGRVQKVKPDPDDALRKRVEVRPLIAPMQVGTVTVLIPRSESDGQTSDGGGGP